MKYIALGLSALVAVLLVAWMCFNAPFEDDEDDDS